MRKLKRAWRWIADRLPHIDRAKPAWWFDSESSVFRIFGFRPYYRCCIFDYTRVLGKTRIAIFGFRWTL